MAIPVILMVKSKTLNTTSIVPVYESVFPSEAMSAEYLTSEFILFMVLMALGGAQPMVLSDQSKAVDVRVNSTFSLY